MELDDLYVKHRQRFSIRFRGFECDQGWRRLIDSTLSDLALVCPDARVVQIKEKFGGLRVYLEDKSNDTAKEVLHDAEERSFTVCEICGEVGDRIVSDGLIRVRCCAHSSL